MAEYQDWNFTVPVRLALIVNLDIFQEISEIKAHRDIKVSNL